MTRPNREYSHFYAFTTLSVIIGLSSWVDAVSVNHTHTLARGVFVYVALEWLWLSAALNRRPLGCLSGSA